jgi:hypothetical protein
MDEFNTGESEVFTLRAHDRAIRPPVRGDGPVWRPAVRMIQLKGAKGGAVWVNPSQVLYAALPDNAASSMYGDNNNMLGTRLHFVQGAHLDVREMLEDVVARLTD